MRYLWRCIATFVIVLALLVTVFDWPAVARADAGVGTTLAVVRPRNANAPRLSIDQPKALLHLEIDGTCEPHRDDAGSNGATCPLLEFQKGDVEGVAVVMGDGYSVDIIIQDDRIGTGEERAKLAAAELCRSIPAGPLGEVMFAGRRFMRAQSPDSSGICFVTADDRPEVAAIIFRDLDRDSMLPVVRPDLVLDLAREADRVMGTLRADRTSPSRTPTTPADHAPERAGASPGPPGLVVLLVLLVLAASSGLLVLATRRKRRSEKRSASGSRDGRQLAGLKCAVCKRNIVSERAAVRCLECEEPVHKDCLGRHATVVHGPPPGAYR